MINVKKKKSKIPFLINQALQNQLQISAGKHQMKAPGLSLAMQRTPFQFLLLLELTSQPLTFSPANGFR